MSRHSAKRARSLRWAGSSADEKTTFCIGLGPCATRSCPRRLADCSVAVKAGSVHTKTFASRCRALSGPNATAWESRRLCVAVQARCGPGQDGAAATVGPSGRTSARFGGATCGAFCRRVSACSHWGLRWGRRAPTALGSGRRSAGPVPTSAFTPAGSMPKVSEPTTRSSWAKSIPRSRSWTAAFSAARSVTITSSGRLCWAPKFPDHGRMSAAPAAASPTFLAVPTSIAGLSKTGT